jgi:hypothetical protein
MPTPIHPATDFEHPILDSSWDYEVVGLRLEKEPTEEIEPFLDLTLRRGSERRTFRFWSPSELEIERGGPLMTGGLTIFDQEPWTPRRAKAGVVESSLPPGKRSELRKSQKVSCPRRFTPFAGA